jgi:hypothetical protein
MENSYKLMRSSIAIKEKRFGIEPEMTAKLTKIPKIRSYEVSISCNGGTN